MASLLEVEGLVAGYGRMTILNGTSFSVRPGTITTIVGPNGAGKSTVFKTLFGLLRPRAGRVTLEGRDITGLDPRRLLQAGLCYVPQGRNLFPELSVRHNLEIGGAALADAGSFPARIEAAFDRFPALRAKAEAQASTLSGGQQKLLEIARGLLLEPRLLLIDEPSIGLSPLMVQEVFGLLDGLRRQDVTVLMVEQNARSALALSDDGIVLEAGRTRLAGPAAAILADPRIGELFLGGGLAESAA
ncbi:MAG TPA: ABC transporter ATP-binding protein [Beijerinckiaceae bacterium]|jgi:branched-chain amino acid transport system ATP-binding protein